MNFVVRRLAIAVGLLLFVPAVIGGLHLGAPAAEEPSSSAFASGDAHLESWRQDMQDGYTVLAAVSTTSLIEDVDPARTLLVVHGPQQEPDQAVLDRHLSGGGSVWILDPDGAYNAWLSSHGVSVGPHRLVDANSPHGSGTVRMHGADAEVVAQSPASLVLDDEAWDVWLRSEAHLDVDGDGTVDRIDVPGPHPVGAARSIAGGQLFVTADASLLSDALRDSAGNPDFARWVARQLLPEGGTIVVDESQHGWTASERLPVAGVQVASHAGSLPTWAALALAIVVAAAAVVAARNASALHPYREHERHDPATPPEEGSIPDTVAQDAAWELLAARTKQPVDRLKKSGTEAAYGLAEDPVLRRVLVGRAQEGDARRILNEYLFPDSRSNGVKP